MNAPRLLQTPMLRLGVMRLRPTKTPMMAVRGTTRALHSTRPALNDTLSWNEFLSLRLRRRRLNVASSAVTAVLAIGGGWGYVSNMEIDPSQMIFGFDPLAVYAVGLIACGLLGSLAGPFVGDIVFRQFMLGRRAGNFATKNTQFLKHIVANRPDPRKHTMANPVTDYYGEKIGSLRDYRQWLRDGNAYKRRSEKFL